MSLFSSIQLASNALQAAQIGLQVTGNNIANANTPGYIRQQAVFEPAVPQRIGTLILGSGVDVSAIKQVADSFLQERLRGAQADLANGEAQESTYTQLEGLIGELGDSDLSTSLTRFFGSVSDVLNQPESLAVRNLAASQGQRLTETIRNLDSRVRQLANGLNDQIITDADKINALLNKIGRLNHQIVTIEGGGTAASDAVGLRDQRVTALGELAAIVDIRSIEQPNGSVTVFTGGDYLVFDGTVRPVEAVPISSDGYNRSEIRIVETKSPLLSSSGEVSGLAASRDGILGGFLDKLNDLSRTLAFEFNKVYSSGQGLTGYSDLTSEFAVQDADAHLDNAGLPFTPVHGAFQVLVRNRDTGITQTNDVTVDLNGLDQDTTLTSLAAALDAISGISASVTPGGKLRIQSDDSHVEFGFANDTSGALAALGLNTFFSGFSSANLNVTAALRADPSKFAASIGGIGQDSRNGELLAGFADRGLDSQNGQTLTQLYERLVGETSQASAVSQSVAEGFRNFQKTLEGQNLAISGVSLDEEAVRMIAYQRTFQASAKYIATLNDLLDTLIHL